METKHSKKVSWLPSSLSARGGLLILLVAVSIGLPSIWVYRVVTVSDSRRYATGLEGCLGVALGKFIADIPEEQPNREFWQTLSNGLEQRVRWAGIFDAKGDGIEFRRQTSMKTQDILKQVDFGGTEPYFKPLELGRAQSERYYVFSVPRPGGQHLLAIVDMRTTLAKSTAGYIAFGCLFAALGITVSVFFYRAAILGPVRRAVRKAATFSEDMLDLSTDSDVPQELAGLLNSVETTQLELRRWQAKATHLQNTIDTHVDSKTREVERQLHEVEKEAETDPLTKLNNRRTLEHCLPDLFTKYRRDGHRLSVALFDVNNFKPFNDTLGHQKGDQLLSIVGKIIRQCTRRDDIAVRYGGDEFVVILPNAKAKDAIEVAKRVVAFFGQQAKAIGRLDPPAGLSAGVAEMIQHGAGSAEALLQMADDAMYFAKRQKLPACTPDDVTEIVPHTGRFSG